MLRTVLRWIPASGYEFQGRLYIISDDLPIFNLRAMRTEVDSWYPDQIETGEKEVRAALQKYC